MNLNTWGQFGQFYGSAAMGSGHSFCNNYGQYPWRPPPPTCDFRRFDPFVFNRFYYPLSPAQMMPVPPFPPAFNQYYPQSTVIAPETRISRRSLWENGEESSGVVIEDVSESMVEPAESATKMADEIISEEDKPFRTTNGPVDSDVNGDGINSDLSQSENDSEDDSQDEICLDDYDKEQVELQDPATDDDNNGNLVESTQVEMNSFHGEINNNGTNGSEIPNGVQTNPADLVPLENVVDVPAFVTRRSDRLRRKLISDDPDDQDEHTEGSNASKKRSKWLQCRRKNCFCCTYKS